MKFLVDQLPAKCGDCQHCANMMAMSALGVQKEVTICALQMQLIPPKEMNQEPNFLDKEKSPEENGCICYSEKKASSIIL